MKQDNNSELSTRVLETVKREGLERYLLSEPLVVGVSGGADSIALLHILVRLRGDNAARTLHVAHLDHALRGEAGVEDALFVKELASAWGIPATVERFEVNPYAREHGLAIEEAARLVRYAFLAGLAAGHGAAVAVGHNADDQAETVLMHILRGSGISGLGGMRMLSAVPLSEDTEPYASPEVQSVGTVPLFRPLLLIWRRSIDAYCTQNGLAPRNDATNADTRYMRNRVRNELLPLIRRDFNAAIDQHLVELSELAAGDDDLIEAITEQEGRRLGREEPGGALSFEQAQMTALHPALRLRIARWALRYVAGTLEGFSRDHIGAMEGIMAGRLGSPRVEALPLGIMVSQSGGRAWITHAGHEVQPSDDDRTLWPQMQPGTDYMLEPGQSITLAAGWILRVSVIDATSGEYAREPGELCSLSDLDALAALGPLTLRTRRAGDVIVPLGMAGRKRLQDLFIDAKIPRRTRNFIPLVTFSGESGEVLWVPGRGGRRSAHAAIDSRTRRILRLEFIRSGED